MVGRFQKRLHYGKKSTGQESEQIRCNLFNSTFNQIQFESLMKIIQDELGWVKGSDGDGQIFGNDFCKNRKLFDSMALVS